MNKGIKEQAGELIRETRKAKGMTQKELGETLGIGESRISKYESGKENPTLETLQTIFEALDTYIFIGVKG